MAFGVIIAENNEEVAAELIKIVKSAIDKVEGKCYQWFHF